MIGIAASASAPQGNGFPPQQIDKPAVGIHEFEQQLGKHKEEKRHLNFEAMHRDIGGEG